MLDGAHNLYLAPYPNEICFRFYLALLDRLDGHLLSRFLVDAELHLTVRALAELFYYVKSGVREKEREREREREGI